MKHTQHKSRNKKTKLHPNPAGLRGVSDHHLPKSHRETQTESDYDHNQKEDNIYIATFNVRTLKTEESLLQLEHALEKIKCHIIGLSEVRRLGEEILDRGEYILFYKGETKGLFGVGFLVKKQLSKEIEEFVGISDRIAVLNINLPGSRNKWSIIQAYAPTDIASQEEKNSFYTSLRNTIENTHKNIILMGDFNSTLGSKETNNNSIGKYTTGKRNDNGTRLLEFAMEERLYIMNTFFKKRFSKKWTWLSPLGVKDERDFILTNNKRAFLDVETLNNLNFNSDHRLVRGRITTKNSQISRKNITKNKTVIPNYIPEDMERNISERLSQIGQTTSIQEKYNIIERELIGLNKQFKTISEKRDRIGPEARNLIIQRQNLLMDKKNNRKEITSISKQINESIRKYRHKTRTDRIQNCIEKTGGVKKAMKELKEEKSWIPSIQDKNKKQTSKRLHIMDVATQFYRNLYNGDESQKNENIDKDYDFQNNTDEVPEFLKREVEHAILSQKNDKSPGDDNITNELLKAVLKSIIDPLTNLFNEILKKEKIPTQWTKTTITLLHKKGDKSDINNYRPVSLMSNIYKVFSKLILGRITKVIEENQPREQAGFRKNFSTIDHISVIKQIVEKCHEYGRQYYVAFVDYNKAFDSLKHNKIWESLKEQGVPEKYIRIIKEIYSKSTAKIKLERIGEEFKIGKGVRQGDPLSPKIFIAVLESVFRRMNWESYGLNINGQKLNHLRFADDLILLTDNPKELQYMLEELDTQSKLVGLSMNMSKTKLMTNNSEDLIKINGNTIEYVSEYVYLGQIISPSDQSNKEIEKRISNAWKRFWSLKEVMKAKEIPTSQKFKVFNMCIVPVLTYGCQTWALTGKQEKRLDTCQNNMERSVLNIKLKDRVKLSIIRARSKCGRVVKKVKQQKWRWTGHIMREGLEKWTKDLIEWYPRGHKRKRGRPTLRWSDDLKRIGGVDWPRKARDRITWKDLEEAYVGRQTEVVDGNIE